ncbi:MAG: hypothetical protein HKN64_01735 [Woeseiaceae bacterium]|nr:hypothetical protein [Woeseiaceae bacterium]
MHRIHLLVLLLFLALPGWAQEEDPQPADGDAAEAEEAADNADEDVLAEDDDEILYDEEDEDVFIPSENVKFGQSIPFPTDI